MTDTNESAVPDPAAAPASPAAPATRSTGKFVAGLILTIIGGLLTLGGLVNIGMGLALSADPAYVIGRIIGGLLLPIAMLIVGIVLLRGSRPKVR